MPVLFNLRIPRVVVYAALTTLAVTGCSWEDKVKPIDKRGNSEDASLRICTPEEELDQEVRAPDKCVSAQEGVGVEIVDTIVDVSHSVRKDGDRTQVMEQTIEEARAKWTTACENIVTKRAGNRARQILRVFPVEPRVEGEEVKAHFRLSTRYEARIKDRCFARILLQAT